MVNLIWGLCQWCFPIRRSPLRSVALQGAFAGGRLLPSGYGCLLEYLLASDDVDAVLWLGEALAGEVEDGSVLCCLGGGDGDACGVVAVEQDAGGLCVAAAHVEISFALGKSRAYGNGIEAGVAAYIGEAIDGVRCRGGDGLRACLQQIAFQCGRGACDGYLI